MMSVLWSVPYHRCAVTEPPFWVNVAVPLPFDWSRPRTMNPAVDTVPLALRIPPSIR